MEKNKTSDSNKISNKIIQILIQEKINLIKQLFQVCLIYKIQSIYFKIAYIIILKKLEKSDYLNLSAYKSITLLNILRKILEAIIFNQIKYIAELYNLLLNSQYKTRSLRIIKTILQQIIEKIHTI